MRTKRIPGLVSIVSTLVALPLFAQLGAETPTERILEEPTVIQGVSCLRIR